MKSEAASNNLRNRAFQGLAIGLLLLFFLGVSRSNSSSFSTVTRLSQGEYLMEDPTVSITGLQKNPGEWIRNGAVSGTPWKTFDSSRFFRLRDGVDEKTGVMWIRLHLPPMATYRSPSLKLFAVNQYFEVWDKNDRIFSNINNTGEYAKEWLDRLKFSTWKMLDIPRWETSNTLYIRIKSSGSRIGILGEIEYGERAEIYTKVLDSEFLTFIVGLLLISFSLAAILKPLLGSRDTELMYFTWTASITGIYLLCRTNSLRMLSENVSLFRLIEIHGAYFILFGEALFLQKKFDAEEKNVILNWTTRVLGFWNLFTLFVTLMAPEYMERPLIFYFRLAMPAIVILLGTIGYYAIKGKNTEARIIGVGAGACGFVAIWDMSISLGWFHGPQNLMPLAFLLLNVSVASSFFYKYSKDSESLKKITTELYSKNEALEKIDKAKDEFIFLTSNELKTPINGIMALSDNLAHMDNTNLSERQSRNLRFIASTARNLNVLVNDLVDFSSIRSGKIELKKRPVSMSRVADTLQSQLNTILDGKKLSYTCEIEEGLPLVDADETRLTQVFVNILTFAAKKTEKGFIRILATQKENQVEVKVIDTGKQMNSSLKTKILNSSMQTSFLDIVNEETKTSGVGIYVAHNLVALHGGTLVFDEHPDILGTQYVFTIPIARFATGVEDASLPVAARPPQKARLRIQKENTNVEDITSDIQSLKGYVLVIDDEPTTLAVVQAHLHALNHLSLGFTEPDKALDVIQRLGKPALVMVDMVIPGSSGLEVCSKLRVNHSPLDLPIILMVDRAQQFRDEKINFKNEVSEFITKPVNRDELSVRVGNLLRMAENRVALTGANQKLERVLIGTRAIASFHELHVAFGQAILRMAMEIMPGQKLTSGLWCTAFDQDPSGAELKRFVIAPFGDPQANGGTPVSSEFVFNSLEPVRMESNALGDLLHLRDVGFESGRLAVPIRAEKVAAGILLLDCPCEDLPREDLEFIRTLAGALALTLDNMRTMEAMVKIELDVKKARLEELGRVTVLLGDRLATPLNVIQLALEEIEDEVKGSVLEAGLSHLCQECSEHLNTVKKELGVLNKFKEFAPKNALEGRLDSPLDESGSRPGDGASCPLPQAG